MAIKVPSNKEISGERKIGGRKGVDCAICWERVNMGAYTFRNDGEEELLREMLTPT